MSRHATRQEDDNRSAFARNFDAALQTTTSEAFARKIGRTLRTVQRWRSGDAMPTGDAVIAIARELGVTVESLYDEPEIAAA